MSDPADRPAAPATSPRRRRRWLGPVIFLAVVGVVVLLGLLLLSIIERRVERTQPMQLVTPIGPWETDPAVWGRNYPREYDRYLRSQISDAEHQTRYGGSVARNYLEQDPLLVVLWAGYGFAEDYRAPRGHYWSMHDVTQSPRIRLSPQTAWATCFTCKTPDAPRLMHEMGVDEFYHSRFVDLEDPQAVESFYAGRRPIEVAPGKVGHPIACLDCHDPQTMNLRISRPALREAWEARGLDIDQAGHQEMRTLVCAQCHVEYYFRATDAHPQDKYYLTFPWSRGLGADEMVAYYNDPAAFPPERYGQAGFVDFVNAISGTPMLKAQHPDYELWTTGVHAFRDVACADCHMPYRTEGGVKFTDHHIQSPLLNVANSCSVCHRWPEQDVLQRVYGMQEKVWNAKVQAERALAYAHFDIAAAEQAGYDDAALAEPRRMLRNAQFRWDYVRSSNGMGFHSAQESMRILMDAADQAQQARLVVARLLGARGIHEPPRYPDLNDLEQATTIMRAFIASRQEGRPLEPGQPGWLLPAPQQ